MTEPTPPPERPMDEGARARIRAELLTHARENRSHVPRWVAPAGAAAAVVLVAGMTWWAVGIGGSEPDSTPVLGGGPSILPVPSSETSATSGTAPSSAPADPSSVPASDQTVEVGTDTCEVELENVLKGATLAVQVDDATSFWVRGQQFVQCDQLAGRTTIHQPLPLTPRDDVSTYAVSTVFADAQNQLRSAGGIVPPGAEGVFDVAYTFDDGHTQHATTATDAEGRTWWYLSYAYPYGGNEMEQPPIEVTVSLSGVQKSYELRPALDTCAQANHGC